MVEIAQFVNNKISAKKRKTCDLTTHFKEGSTMKPTPFDETTPLAKFMKEKGFNISKFAAYLGVSRDTASRLLQDPATPLNRFTRELIFQKTGLPAFAPAQSSSLLEWIVRKGFTSLVDAATSIGVHESVVKSAVDGAIPTERNRETLYKATGLPQFAEPAAYITVRTPDGKKVPRRLRRGAQRTGTQLKESIPHAPATGLKTIKEILAPSTLPVELKPVPLASMLSHVHTKLGIDRTAQEIIAFAKMLDEFLPLLLKFVLSPDGEVRNRLVGAIPSDLFELFQRCVRALASEQAWDIIVNEPGFKELLARVNVKGEHSNAQR